MPISVSMFGHGGHAKVVADAMLSLGYGLKEIFDACPRSGSPGIFQNTTSLPLPDQLPRDCNWHIAIGNNIDRSRILGKYAESRHSLVTMVHPRATVSAFSQLGVGSFIGANGIVAADSSLGAACIINHGAVVDHDCRLGDAVHIAPNAALGGGGSVGSLALVGAGATVLPNLTIGERAIIGAGAVVTTNISAGQVVIGIPGRPKG